MIRTILKNIADYFTTNLPGTFKGGYYWVEQIRQDVDGEERIYPGYYEEGFNEPRPLLNDHQTNYFYIRRTGEVTTEDGPVFSSCGSDLVDTYPMRIVFHLREGRTHKGMEWTRDLKYFLSQYNYTMPANSELNKVQLFVTSAQPDKYEVLGEEITGGDWRPLDEDTLVSIDFDLVITYSPGTCISEPVICGDLGTITQVEPCVSIPCADVTVTDTDDSVNLVASGGSFTCTKQLTQIANAVQWTNFEKTSENASFVTFNAHVLEKDDTAAVGLNAGASSTTTVTSVSGTLSQDAIGTVAIGLKKGSPGAIVPTGISDIDHGVYFLTASNGRFQTIDGGAQVGYTRNNLRADKRSTTWQVLFDTLTGTVEYYFGGALVHTSAITYGLGQTWHVYAILYTPEAKLFDITYS